MTTDTPPTARPPIRNAMLIALAAVLVVVSLFLTLLVYRSVMHPIDNMEIGRAHV